MQTLLSDAMYSQMTSQLKNNYIIRKRTNVIDRISVLDVTLVGWSQDSTEDRIIARLRTRITDYIKDDVTGTIISGSPSREKFMEYEWALTRTTGVTTAMQRGTVTTNCPNCGAPIDINKSSICPYCDSVIKSGTHDWVISTIKGISQRTI